MITSIAKKLLISCDESCAWVAKEWGVCTTFALSLSDIYNVVEYGVMLMVMIKMVVRLKV